MISFLIGIYIGGVISNYAELRSARHPGLNERLLDLMLALSWLSYVYDWLKPVKKPPVASTLYDLDKKDENA